MVTTNKKIILVIPSLAKGGAERVVSLLSQQFEKMSYEVKIVIFQQKIEYPYGGELIDLKAPASRHYLVKLLRFSQRIHRLRTLFKKEKADYIFSFMESANFPTLLTRFKVIISVHINPNKNYGWLYRNLIKYLYRFKNIKKTVAVSYGVQEVLNQSIRKNITHIYNPVIINKHPTVSKDLSQHQPFILSVGRLAIQKNYEMLIKAFAKSQSCHQAKLLIIGEGGERNKLQHLIEDLQLKNRILLTGQKNNVEDYYLQCQFFVLSSHYEGLGNVLVEALAHHCPCISTDCPSGPREIITHNENGILVENENCVQMTEAIDRLFNDKVLQDKFKKNAQKSVERFRIENIALQWLQLK